MTYRYIRGPYVNVMNWNEYISRTLLLIRAKISSMHIMKSQAAINLFAVVTGFFVEINRPEKNDCDIPIYKTGSMFTIKNDDNYLSNITKSR